MFEEESYNSASRVMDVLISRVCNQALASECLKELLLI